MALDALAYDIVYLALYALKDMLVFLAGAFIVAAVVDAVVSAVQIIRKF